MVSRMRFRTSRSPSQPAACLVGRAEPYDVVLQAVAQVNGAPAHACAAASADHHRGCARRPRARSGPGFQSQQVAGRLTAIFFPSGR